MLKQGGVETAGTPFLEIIEQPQSRFRFRYESEMRGTHGCLVGEGHDAISKRFPSVKLNNFHGKEAVVRLSLATNEDDPYPHVHSLVVEKGQGKDVDFIDIKTNAAGNYVAAFQGIAIIHRGKRFVNDVLTTRLVQMKLQKMHKHPKNRGIQELPNVMMHEVREMAKRKSPGIDPHSVKLKFEAFQLDVSNHPISISDPVYSKPIFNEKGAQTGTLKIVKIDKAYSNCTGREEIFVFVEKVSKKNIKIRFFELDSLTRQENWHAFADFSEADVHHQYAIAFRTPPFRDSNIDEDVQVFMELYRPQDGARSEPRPFTYKPSDRPRKRTRTGGLNGVSGMNDQLSNVLKYIMEDAPCSSGSLTPYTSDLNDLLHPDTFTESTHRTNQDRAQRNWGPKSSHVSPEISYSVSPQSSFVEECFFSSCCDSPDMQYQQDLSPHPHPEMSSVEASPHRSPCGPRLDLCGPSDRLRTLEDLYDNEEIPDLLDFASPNPDTGPRYSSFLQEIPDSYEMILLDNIQRGGPPNLSSGNLASDYATVTNEAAESKFRKDADSLAEMIGGFSLNGPNLKRENDRNCDMRTLDETVPVGHITSKHHGEPEKRDVKKTRPNLNLGLAVHTLLQMSNDQKFSATLQLIVKSGQSAALDWKNGENLTPLHIAVSHQKVEAVQQLIRAGASVNVPNASGDSVLHIAAGDEEYAPVLRLLLGGRNVEKVLSRRNNKGLTPLHVAVKESAVANVRLLLDSGADPNQSDHLFGRTALHLAVQEDLLPVAVALLQDPKKIDIHAEAYNGDTVLALAQNEEMKELLISAGAKWKVVISDSTEEDQKENIITAA